MNGKLSVNDRVTLRTAPGRFAPYAGLEGVIASVTPASIVLASVEFDMPGRDEPILVCDTQNKVLVCDVPAPYLAPVRKRARKGVLNLHEVKDTRTEAQKLADITAWLTGLGYVVLGVGQHRAQAVCWKCTTEQRKAGHSPLVKVFCPSCRTPAFSPTTGNAEGYPDLSIRHPTRWKPGAVMLVEGKRDEKADRRQKQIELANAGWSVFAHDKRGFAQAIRRFEHDVLGIDTLHEIEQIATT